jgi:FAD/FMN-containing dehydrogenase
VQKEGCDGLITSATFILHRMPKHVRTVCLEFFGDVKKRVPSIVEIKDYIDQHPKAILAGLEHLDERYVKAVGYATKAKSRGRPRMILIGDIVSDDENAAARPPRTWCASPTRATARASSRDRRAEEALLARPRAHRRDLQAHQRLQDQRGRGDPARRLGDYTEGIERINIEFSIANKLKLVARLQASSRASCRARRRQGRRDGALRRPPAAGARAPRARARAAGVRARQPRPARAEVRTDLEGLGMDSARSARSASTVFERVQLHNMRISWKAELREPLREIFAAATSSR